MGAFPFMKCTHKSYSNKHKPYPHLFLCLFSSLTITSSLLASTRPPHAPATRASIPLAKSTTPATRASIPHRQINNARNASVHSPSPNQQRPQRGRPFPIAKSTTPATRASIPLAKSTTPATRASIHLAIYGEGGAERPGVRSNHRRKSASAPSRKNETFLDSLAQANYNIRVESWEWFLALD